MAADSSARVRKNSHTSTFGTVARVCHDSSDYYASRLYDGLEKKPQNRDHPDHSFPAELENQILQASSELMQAVPDNCVHLMVTSPPYNASKDYDLDLSLEEYLLLLRRVFTETYRVLVEGGRACVNIANLGRRPYIPLSDYISHIMLDIGFVMRGEIIWNKGAAAGVSMAWGSWRSASNPVLRDTHEYILVFSKGSLRRKCNEGQTSTISREDFMEWTKSVWTMNTESARKIGHPAPFPLELPYRLIQLYTFSNDVVLDPFIGSGTTALAAMKAARRFIGYEINGEYIQLAQRRIRNYQ